MHCILAALEIYFSVPVWGSQFLLPMHWMVQWEKRSWYIMRDHGIWWEILSGPEIWPKGMNRTIKSLEENLCDVSLWERQFYIMLISKCGMLFHWRVKFRDSIWRYPSGSKAVYGHCHETEPIYFEYPRVPTDILCSFSKNYFSFREFVLFWDVIPLERKS